MKKLLLSILICLSALSLFAETRYMVETKTGPQEVVIPDGYSEKDVLLTIATAYYNQTEDYNQLLEKVEKLTKDTSTYIDLNTKLRSDYDNLIKDYDLLVKKLTAYNSLSAVKGIGGIQLGIKDKNLFAGVSLGALLFNKFAITGTVAYPLSFSINFNYIF